MPSWSETDIPDQTGRVMVVTGATGGLGLRVAEVLAAHGARVLMGARNPGRGAAALARVAASARGTPPELVSLDLSSLASVRAAAADIRARTGDRLDLLLNNGGIMAPPLSFSVDGYELQWATNVLGAAALTWQLLPAIEATPHSRLVFVSSTRHLRSDFDEARVRADVRGENYRGFDFYGRTKLADLLLSDQLEQHFRANGIDSSSVAAHPGFTATGIVANGFGGLPRVLHPAAIWGMRRLGQPVEIGALPILYAGTAPNLAGPDYFGPRALWGLRGAPGPARRSAASRDTQLGKTLVRVVEELAGVVSGM
jgi:NAD(P)-dependent dehydrogenase (short-subunit alcohol dehydrogenase family)